MEQTPAAWEWPVAVFLTAIGLVLILPACATDPEVRQVQTATALCQTIGGAIRSLAVLKAQGNLTPAQIERVDETILRTDPICSAPNPPDTRLTLDELEAQLLIMQGIRGIQ